MTVAQSHDDWTSTELARHALDAVYADLMRETLGGKHPKGWSRWVYPCDELPEVEAVHRFLVELGERVGRDAERVLDHLGTLRASADADAAEVYDEECGAR